MNLNNYYTNERRDMLAFLPAKPTRTIEFGCSAGVFSAIVKEKFHTETWGVDFNREAAEEAGKRLDKVIVGDAMEVLNDLPEKYFDCLICNDILEHLPYPDLFLKKVRKILAKDAHITCSVPNVRSWGHFIHYFVGKDWKYEDFGILDNTHLRFFTKKSLIRMLENSEIEIEIIRGITRTNTILFNLANILSLGFISDMRYLEYGVRGRFR